MLTHTNNLAQANDIYHSGGAVPNDIGTVFLDGDSDGEDTFVPGYWCVADFNLAFDHLTPTKLPGEAEEGEEVALPGEYELHFDFDGIHESSVELLGNFELVTQTYGGNIDKSEIKDTDADGKPLINPTTGKHVKSYLEGAKKITKNIPSESDLRKFFKNEKTEFTSNNSATIGNTKFSQSFKVTMEELSEDDNEFVKFLTGVSKHAPIVGDYIGAALSVVDFFSGKANPSPQKVEIMPTISKGSLNLSGSIISTGNLGNITLELPGTPHLQDNQTPYYDCPLGVIGLEEEPEVEIKRVNFAYEQYAVFELMYNGWECREAFNLREYKSIKIKDDLKIALNKSAGVSIVDLKASLVCIDDQDHWDNFAKDGYSYSRRHGGLGCSEYKVNPFFDFLNNGVFVVSGKNQYSTPFVDVENFKNTSIFCYKDAFVYLKIYAILEATDEGANDTPILFSASYNLSEPTSSTTACYNYEDLNNYIFPFTQAQLSQSYQIESDLVEVISNTTITNGSYSNFGITTLESVIAQPTAGNINFSAKDKIILKPGFSCNAQSTSNSITMAVNQNQDGQTGFIDIDIIEPNYTPINNILKPYFENMNCDCGLGVNLKGAKLSGAGMLTGLKNEAEKEYENAYGPTIYPNPATDNLYVQNKYFDLISIKIVNTSGKVMIRKIIEANSSSVDVSNLSAGLYIVHLKVKDKVFYKKMLKN